MEGVSTLPHPKKVFFFHPKINITFPKLATAGTLGDNCAIEPIMLQLSPWTSLHQVLAGEGTWDTY